MRTLTKHWEMLKGGVGPLKEDMQTLLSTLSDTLDQESAQKGNNGLFNLMHTVKTLKLAFQLKVQQGFPEGLMCMLLMVS